MVSAFESETGFIFSPKSKCLCGRKSNSIECKPYIRYIPDKKLPKDEDVTYNHKITP